MRKMQLKAIAALSVLTLAGCAEKVDLGAPKYSADRCRVVKITDKASGASIKGAEDFAFDRENGRLFFSAYDRRAVEKAARKKKQMLPQGGVYAIGIEELFNASGPIELSSLVAPGDISGGLHPHGISYDAANRELVFVNRTYSRAKKRWRMTPTLQRIGANGEMFVGVAKLAPCSANDVLVREDGGVVTSFDHGSCGFGGAMEDLFNLKRSGFVNDDGERLFKKAGFANGLAGTKDGDVLLAATRENSLTLLSGDGTEVTATKKLKTPGGPDNIMIAEDGDAIAALHPSLWRLGLNRKLGMGHAPSRIVRVDIDSGRLDLLFDDTTGKTFSAATVGIETDYGLAAGSATDEGLLVCRKA